MDNVCNRRLFSFPAKVEMAEEQEYFCCIILFLFEVNGVPTPNLGKPSEASTCFYVTSHWQ